MAGKGVPLTDDERRGLLEWTLLEGPEAVGSDLGSSADSIANWLAGLCWPFAPQQRVVARKLKARRTRTRDALREAARSLAS